MRALCLAVLASLSLAATSNAQIESFSGVAPGSYTGFSAFTAPAGIGWIARLGAGGLLVVDNGSMFPSSSAPNAMFGRGVDVQFKLQDPRKRFFGQFRSLPFIAVPPNQVQIRFFLTSGVWSPWLASPINTLGYTPTFWDVGTIFGQGYWAAQIRGNGSLPGYVGMDTLFVF